MIKLRDAFRLHIRQPGRPNEYRVVRLVFCTCDRNRGTGGDRITLKGARLSGRPTERELKGEQNEDPEKNYRKGNGSLNFYDEHTQRHYRVHIDLIESVNDLEIL